MMERIIFRLGVLTILFAFFNFSFQSFAQSVRELEGQIKARDLQVQALQKEVEIYNEKVLNSQAKAGDLKSALAVLELQKKNLQNQIALTNLKKENTLNSLKETESKILENEAKLKANQVSLGRFLTQMKILEETDNFIFNLLNGEGKSFSENLNESFRINNLNLAILEKSLEIESLLTELEGEKLKYQKQQEDLNNLSVNLSVQTTLLAQNMKEKNTLFWETKNQEKIYQRLISLRKEKIKDLKDEIFNFESQIRFILDKSKLPPVGPKLFSWPLTKVSISQYFGDTPFAISGAYNGKSHNGLDFRAGLGTPVYAVADGVVTETGNTDLACRGVSYGKWVLINHQNGLTSLYAHLSFINVQKGQIVSTGSQIGFSGKTGYSTGPHLHFTVFASEAVKIFGPREYRSKICGTYLVIPYAPLAGYLNPLDYLPKN